MKKKPLINREKIISVDKGNVLHAIKNNSIGYKNFGEAYFSIVKSGSIKGWKRHKLMTMNFLVPIGEVRFIILDENENNEIIFQEFKLSQKNYYRLTLPPLIWYGFQGIASIDSLVLNVADIIHDPDEIETRDLDSVDFNW